MKIKIKNKISKITENMIKIKEMLPNERLDDLDFFTIHLKNGKEINIDLENDNLILKYHSLTVFNESTDLFLNIALSSIMSIKYKYNAVDCEKFEGCEFKGYYSCDKTCGYYKQKEDDDDDDDD